MATDITAVQGNTIISCLMVDLDIDGTTYYLSNAYKKLTYNSNTYTELGAFLGVSEVAEDIRATNGDITLNLSGVPSSDGAYLSLVLTTNIKGGTVKVYRGFFDQNTFELDTSQVYTRFNGVITNFAITEDNNRGYVYVYVKPGSGWTNTATETAKLSGSGTSSNSRFGFSTDISGDGNTIAVSTNNVGYVYIFDKPTNGWTGMSETTKFTGYDGGLNGSISMVKDGSAVFSSTSGSATYFCEKINGVWGSTSDYQTKLGGGGGSGSIVSTSTDGSVSVVGDTQRSDNGTSTGVATIME